MAANDYSDPADTESHFSISPVLAADVVFRAVGVQRDFGPIEHLEQFSLVDMEPSEQTVESDEAGAAREDAIEVSSQSCRAR